MFSRGVCVAFFALLLCLPGVAAAADKALQPVRPWVVDYDAAECNAQRGYGDAAKPIFFALRPSPWGNSYELLIVRKERGPEYAEEVNGWVDFGNGPIKAWVLHYGLKGDSPLNTMQFRISSNDVWKAASATQVTFRIDGKPQISFALFAFQKVLSNLHTCNVDLRRYWNMTEADQKNVVAPAQGDIRHLFSWHDYPDEAMYRSQEGTAQFLLFIDEKGKVAACHVVKPSGIPVFNGMGCQVIRQRAKFKAAVGPDGKPVRSSVVTPPITWQLAG